MAFGDLILSILLAVNVTTNITFWILSVVALEHYIVSHVIFFIHRSVDHTLSLREVSSIKVAVVQRTSSSTYAFGGCETWPHFSRPQFFSHAMF